MERNWLENEMLISDTEEMFKEEEEEEEKSGYHVRNNSKSVGSRKSGRKRKAKEFDRSRFIPAEITFDILSRLPFESILECRCVCKSWSNLIFHSTFGEFRVRRRLIQQLGDHNQSNGPPEDDKVSFLFLTMDETKPLYYGEYVENKNSCMKVEKINHPPIKKQRGSGAMVGSCNGLVCFSVPYTHHIEDPVYICNPITREFVNLPRFTIEAKNKYNVVYKKTTYLDGSMVSGFGYLPSTNEYKVVRIYYGPEQPVGYEQPKGQVQVYTLGEGSGWRNKGEITYSLQHYDPFRNSFVKYFGGFAGKCKIHISTRGILANGALHWLDKEWQIVAFDLALEEFSLLPSPPCFCPGKPNFYQPQVLDGCLCVVHEKKGKSLDIWAFKKHSGKWESMFRIDCGSKLMDVYWPVTLTISGQILLRYDYETLVRYNPKTGKIRKLVNLDTNLIFECMTYPLVEAIPHKNSFVSLKALGEKSKIRKLLIEDLDMYD